MAVAIPMPKLGNTVESTLLVRWHKQIGDTIAIGETLCEVETDKATLEVESSAAGTVLALFYKEGDEVPIMVNIAVVGVTGEDISIFDSENQVPIAQVSLPAQANISSKLAAATEVSDRLRVSPRARNLAARKHIDLSELQGTGPDGRIIERDIQAAIATAAKLTPVAKSMIASGDFVKPEHGTGRRVTKKDLIPVQAQVTPSHAANDVEIIPLKGTRKIIAGRMLESLQTTAQLTLNTSAVARALKEYRKRLKASPAELGLQDITINDLLLFAVSRTLTQFPDLNSLFHDNAIHRYKQVHLGMAVNSERGLLVPVIRNAHTLSLKALANEAHRLADACLQNHILPDELKGATFTVTNLGSLGIESFTPILNAPQVGILGVGSIQLKAVEADEGVAFIPHLSLSLTINHQIIDGAPGARFLQALSRHIEHIDLLQSM